ncbi:MAG: hypothetical protein NTW05_23560 [Pseudonocardiales bacterium]|nr:hypothetical protein [Pseudonocardiales bacterium]
MRHDPRHHPRHRRLSLLLATALLALPACGTAVGARATAPPVTAVSTAPAPATALPGAGPAGPAEAGDLLLTAAEVGPGYGRGAPPVADPDTPTACGGPGTVAAFPDAVRAGIGFTGPDPRQQVAEEVAVYPDAATAAAAHAHAADGLACGEGSAAGLTVVITPAEDLTADVGGDAATGWRLGHDRLDAVVVIARRGAVVATFTVAAAAGAELPDPLPIAAAGVAKLG